MKKIILIIVILFIIYIIFKCIKSIKNFIVLYRKSNVREKDKTKALLWIFLIPCIFFLIDYYNVFSDFFPRYSNMTNKYDFLSFIGTYLGAIVSAIFLIIITEKDRRENTNVLRESQRPYLDVSFMNIKSKFFKNHDNKTIVFEHGKSSDKKNIKKEYLTLCIKNNGASVAIIDINKTNISIQQLENNNIIVKTFQLNTDINRLSIKSGEQIYIKFCSNVLYSKSGKLLDISKIIKSKIYYKDLFNMHYFDECELNNTLEVINDNVLID